MSKKKRIPGFIRALVKLTGRLARRVLAALLAVVIVFLILLLILLFGGRHMPFADAGAVLRIIMSVITLTVGAIFAFLLGFAWPSLLLSPLSAFDWLADIDFDLPDLGGLDFFDGDD